MLVWLNTVNLHTNQSNARVKSICLFVNLLLMASFTAHAEKNQPFIGDKQKRLDSMRNIPVRLLPYDYYSNHLGFFCKNLHNPLLILVCVVRNQGLFELPIAA